MRRMLKSKIHRARVNGLDIEYEGSITIDKRLMQAADILPYEQVEVLNLHNGARFNTYAIQGEGEGEICLNGAAARLAAKGDTIIILAYCYLSDDDALNLMPNLVSVNEKNAIVANRQPVPPFLF